MKHLLSTIALVLVGSIAAFGSYNFLRISTVEGDTYFFSFEKDPVVTVKADGLTVTTNDAEPASFSFANFSHFDFAEADSSNIDGPALNMGWNAGTLTLSDLPAATIVGLYTLDGKTIFQKAASGSFSLDRNSLPKGVYILKAGNFSVKLAI